MDAQRITVADDEANVLFVLNQLLAWMYPNSSISTFSNGPDALAHIVETGTDLLITDHGMGETSGAELTAMLRAKGINIPVIMMSGNPAVRTEAMAAGANDFIEKGFSPTALEECIRRLLPL